jgi:microcystin-dependent protein
MTFLERISPLGSTLLLCFLLVGQTALAAQPDIEDRQPRFQVAITEVFVDLGNELIVIRGEDFDFGPGPLLVALGDLENPAAGEITSLCVDNLSVVPQTIVCDFSADGLPPDGDYLLAVSTGNGRRMNAEYDLTIGGRGPAGPQGEQGKLGPQGEQGKLGPPGEPGPQGEQGKIGPQGEQGKIGPQGEQGKPQGEQGKIGPQGEQGKMGPQGEQGKIGPQGEQGKVGPQGEQGKIGPQGEQGKIGPPGPQGKQGKMGPQGEQGKIGPQGEQGKIGPQGPQGKEGPEGPIGGTGDNVLFSPSQDTNMQPYLALNYIIALQGLYPSRSSAEPYLAEIVLFAGNFAPRGWAYCDGQLLPIMSYQALFSLLGTTYGGDGRTTFALPDLRGRAPVHAGGSAGPGLARRQLGQRGGMEEEPSHNHLHQ